MRLLRRLYATRGFRDPAGAMVADGLLLAVVAVAAVRGEFVLMRRPGVRKGHRNAFPK